jgi:hypothetical protein
MERCPNCGAPARPGAKFCTTCGYRLPAAAPSEPTPEAGGRAAASTASSWPPPPTSATTESSASAQDQTTDPSQGSDEVIAMPATAPEADADATAEAGSEADSGTDAESTDSVLSSSWPSPAPATQSDPWAATTGTGDNAAAEADRDVGVAEEVVVVPAPASQYEGWSSAVVEEVAPVSKSGGTTIARAIALLDELRLLLPALNTAAASDDTAAIDVELQGIITAGNEAAADRQALREALRAARDDPRDIQTILALSQQADAAIALLDEHDRLVSTVQRALASRGSGASSDDE